MSMKTEVVPAGARFEPFGIEGWDGQLAEAAMRTRLHIEKVTDVRQRGYQAVVFAHVALPTSEMEEYATLGLAPVAVCSN